MPDFSPLFRSLIDGGQAVYFSYDLAAARVVYVSQAYERVFEGPAARADDELPRWLSRVHPDDRPLLHQQLTQALAGELVENVDVRVATPAGGGVQWLRFAGSLEVLADGQRYLSGTVLDITKVQETAINAQKFNTKKDATLEILSHDLAAPLVLLQQLTEHLRLETQDGAGVQELLRLMERTCTDGVHLIRDFVDNEFLESSNVELKRERANLVAWLRTIMEEYQRSEWHTHLQFHFEAAEESIFVSLDINKFQQVINNLLSNAIKFTPDGGTLTVRVARQDALVLVTITDTGIGVPAELQPLLFDKFTKARRTGLRGEKTTGLGMSIIQTIVELHQGRIWLESAEGAGTTFFIEVPALPA
ncbi:PAS domain-containing sensor histidine kinase [Hymenobacter weizhouensis]|uniref:PAS domain-containing sensor histidine kinase n=1 Tax=Hymenobacter sp. YIM 151500-1 TaxID=2987689 RepID=UPI002225FEB4|nr:PAS domain-containing sensor histidine kinase [Hymenobacter sp. YIM 151500-1]UYZ64066.1 PAS domain-containing sensor histidine kinase [Hymenobacter sp. YIM 151500-1]